VDISRLETTWRIHREDESQGLVPGEAAAFLAISNSITENPLCRISGIGMDEEVSSCTVLSDGHPTGKGLERALQKAIDDAGIDESEIGVRLSDLNGERYGAMDSMLALSRFYRTYRKGLPIWHPAECFGEVGAAAGALLIQIGACAQFKGYAPEGSMVCETSSENGLRAACVLPSVAA
jgi:3-oxoacyl-[acyl-carrier-protein] synthase I